MTTGRNVPKTGQPLTLSTGVTVYVRKVSPYTRNAVARSVPKPQPPMIDVDYDGTTRSEPNEDDLGYLRQLKKWQEEVNLRAGDVMLRLGVQVDIDHDALAAVREVLEASGVPVDADDHLAYIKHVAVGCDDDMTAMGHIIASTSQPTEEAVQDHLDTFPDRVPGSAAEPVATENGGTLL